MLVASAIATCIDQTSTCARDPCLGLYLRGVWFFINSSIVLGVGATAVTVFGFSLWRKEFCAKEDHDGAKVVVRASYKLRAAFTNLRNRIISSGESAAAQGESHSIYGKRWRRFLEALDGLEDAVGEGAVLWGLKYQDRMIPVRMQVVDLEFALIAFLEGRDSKEWLHKESSVKAAQEIFGSGKDGDVIGKKLIAALDKIEADAEKKRICSRS